LPEEHRPAVPRLTSLHHSHYTAHTILAHRIADEADEEEEWNWLNLQKKTLGLCKQFTNPHGVTYHKTWSFSNTAVRTSNLATHNLAPLQVTSCRPFSLWQKCPTTPANC